MEKKMYKQNVQEMQKKKQTTVKKFKEGVVKVPKLNKKLLCYPDTMSNLLDSHNNVDL